MPEKSRSTRRRDLGADLVGGGHLGGLGEHPLPHEPVVLLLELGDHLPGLGRFGDLGIDPADVLALGDGHNDLEMLRWAGRGVAMGDAPPDVQQAAGHVTGRFADGGTVAELLRWF